MSHPPVEEAPPAEAAEAPATEAVEAEKPTESTTERQPSAAEATGEEEATGGAGDNKEGINVARVGKCKV